MKCQISWLTLLLHTSIPQSTGTTSFSGLNLMLMIPLSFLLHHCWLPESSILSMIVIRQDFWHVDIYSEEVPRQGTKRKKLQQQTSTENKQHPYWKEGRAEHIVRSDTKHDGKKCRRGGETHCQQFMCCANDFSITQCSQHHDFAYCLCQSCQGVSTHSGREQKPTIHIFQDVKPHKNKRSLFSHCTLFVQILSPVLCVRISRT